MKTIIMVVFGLTLVTNAVLGQTDDYVPKAPKYFVGGVGEKEEQEVLKNLPPELKAELLKVKELNPEQYKALLSEILYNRYDVYAGFLASYEKEQFETQKQIQQLELFTESLGFRYEYANDGDKQKISSDLKSRLNQLFDMKEKARTLEVGLLEKELAQLKESLKVRKKNKSEIINRRMNELIGKGDYLDW